MKAQGYWWFDCCDEPAQGNERICRKHHNSPARFIPVAPASRGSVDASRGNAPANHGIQPVPDHVALTEREPKPEPAPVKADAKSAESWFAQMRHNLNL